MTYRFNHVGMRVSDVPAAAMGYRELYGAQITFISPVGSEAGCAALCQLPDGMMLELFEPDKGFAGLDCGPLGLIHTAFSTDDVDESFRAALAAGGTLLHPPTDVVLDLYPDVSFRTAFYRDADGAVFELMEHNWAAPFFAEPRSASGARVLQL